MTQIRRKIDLDLSDPTVLCRTCALARPADQIVDERGTCRDCWLKRATPFLRPRRPSEPCDGPLSRVVCQTLAGLVRRAELGRPGAFICESDRLLLASTDGSTVFELGVRLQLDSATVMALVQDCLDRALIELVPEAIAKLVAPGLAPELVQADIAPALGGDRHLPTPASGHTFQPAPPIEFKYPARSPLPPPMPDRSRFGRRRRR